MGMQVLSPESDRWLFRSATLAAIGALIVGASIGLNLLQPAEQEEGLPPPTPAVQTTAPVPVDDGAAAPSFDVVRVTPAGDAVIAGRGTAGAQVSIHIGEEVLGTVTSDSHGEWVLVPEKPLPAGNHRMFAELRTKDGQTHRSVEDILVVVPDPAGGPQAPSRQPLVLRMLPDGSPAPLAAPDPIPAAGALVIERLDDDMAGRSELVGRAAAGARVRLHLDGRPLGETRAGTDGIWRLPVARPFAPGTSVLSAEVLDRRGAVLQQMQLAVTLPADRPRADADRVLVQEGDNLWQIAREVYGHGAAFTVIFEANRAQIENPDRIYPGQRFQLPASSPNAPAPGRP